jgi:catechol 2,3-dioxygenase-like lactoylglutathione lyase family enzyme
MNILGVDEVTYGVEDLALGRRFYEDWGLTLTETGPGRLVFETLNGCRVILADKAAAGLPAPIEPGSTVREVVWGLSDPDAPEVCLTDPNGLAVRFRPTRKRAVDVQGCPVNTWDHPVRVNRPATVYDRARPIEIGHIVFFTNPERLDALTRFYLDQGFVLSDSYPGRGVFLRASARGGHHDLFLLSPPGSQPGLNHLAFTVRDIHEVFGGGLHISRCGWETQLGPGRHPISSAYFWYVKNPCGGLSEYYADEDVLTEAWTAREFSPSNEAFAEWAIAGGVDGNTRRQKNVEPPPATGKFMTERS